MQVSSDKKKLQCSPQMFPLKFIMRCYSKIFTIFLLHIVITGKNNSLVKMT